VGVADGRVRHEGEQRARVRPVEPGLDLGRREVLVGVLVDLARVADAAVGLAKGRGAEVAEDVDVVDAGVADEQVGHVDGLRMGRTPVCQTDADNALACATTCGRALRLGGAWKSADVIRAEGRAH
jgi:hypothetical protein